MNLTGLSPQNALKYLGPNVYLPIIVSRTREPTSADIKQPETGKYYSFGTFWLIGKDPTTGEYGDIWYLANIQNNAANWLRFPIGAGETITGDNGGPLDPFDENWNIIGQQNGIIPVMQTNGSGSTLRIEDRTSTTAYVVDPSSTPGQRGTFTTIQAAITAANSGDTVFVKAGTYVENPILKGGVNVVAYGGSAQTPNVKIQGKCSLALGGTCTLFGIAIETNGDYAISITGTAACFLYLVECNVTCSNFCAINLSSTNASSFIRVVDSWCRTSTNATNFFNVTGAGSLTFWNVNVLDPTPQTINSTFTSTGTIQFKYSVIRFPVTTSGTGRISATNAEFNTFQTNSTPLTISADASSGSGFGNYLRGCTFLSGNTIALTINQLVNMGACHIVTTGSIPISGTGTIRQSGTTYTNSGVVPSSTSLTINRQPFDPGLLYGNWSGAAHDAGYVGQKINSYIPIASGVDLTTDTPVNVTAIILTPGTWRISGAVMFNGLTTATSQVASIGLTSATIPTNSYGRTTVCSNATSTSGNANGISLTIPTFQQLVSVSGGNVLLYLIASATFSASTTPVAYGYIEAVREV